MNTDTKFVVYNGYCTLNINAPISGSHDLILIITARDHGGTFNINAPCTHTGDTIIETQNDETECKIKMGVNNAVPCGDVFLNVVGNVSDASTILDLNDKTQKVSNLHLSIDSESDNNKVIITGSDAGVIEITNTFTSTESGVFQTLIKQMGGKIICNGPSCSIGTKMIINNATFINNGSWQNGANGYFELQSGAKIGGTGILGRENTASSNLIITSGATIAPGNGIGEVSCWNLEMQSDSEYDWEINGNSADSIYVNGNLDISAGEIIVNVINAGSPNGGSELTLFTANTINGDESDITMNYGPGVAGPEHPTIDSNNITATVTPEPGIIGLLSLLGLAILRRK